MDNFLEQDILESKGLGSNTSFNFGNNDDIKTKAKKILGCIFVRSLHRHLDNGGSNISDPEIIYNMGMSHIKNMSGLYDIVIPTKLSYSNTDGESMIYLDYNDKNEHAQYDYYYYNSRLWHSMFKLNGWLDDIKEPNISKFTKLLFYMTKAFTQTDIFISETDIINGLVDNDIDVTDVYMHSRSIYDFLLDSLNVISPMSHMDLLQTTNEIFEEGVKSWAKLLPTLLKEKISM